MKNSNYGYNLVKLGNYEYCGVSTMKKYQWKFVTTVVGDYINTMKTTFDFNFDLYQAVKQHGYI